MYANIYKIYILIINIKIKNGKGAILGGHAGTAPTTGMTDSRFGSVYTELTLN